MERIKIAEVSTQIRGVSYKPSDLRDSTDPEAVILLRANNIGEGKINFDDIVYVDKQRITEDQYLKKGDILICASSGSKNLVGKAAGFDLDVKCTFGAFCKVVRPTECNPEYLSLYFMSDAYRRKITASAIGANINNIRNEHIDSLEINIYPEEENEIICKLRAIRQIVEFRKSQLSALDTLIKARFVEMFGNLERTTTIARYISELRGGKSLAGTETCKNKVLKTGAATFGWFNAGQYKYLPTDYEPLPEHRVETGDVIISRMNTPDLVGACAYVFEAPENMYYPDRLWKAVLKENTNPIFLWQLLWDTEVRKAIKERSGGTSGTMHNISKPNLLSIKCIDVPIDIQNRFAAFVSEVDKSKFYEETCAALTWHTDNK